MDAGDVLVMFLIAGTLVLLIAGEVHCRRNDARKERQKSTSQPSAELPHGKDSESKLERKQVA